MRLRNLKGALLFGILAMNAFGTETQEHSTSPTSPEFLSCEQALEPLPSIRHLATLADNDPSQIDLPSYGDLAESPWGYARVGHPGFIDRKLKGRHFFV